MTASELAGDSQVTRRFSCAHYISLGLTRQHYAVVALVSLKYVHSHANYFHTDIPARKTTDRDWKHEMFNNALDVIALSLPRSDYSTELLTLSHDVRLIELEDHFPWYLEKAKAAISEYLAQWDGQER